MHFCGCLDDALHILVIATPVTPSCHLALRNMVALLIFNRIAPYFFTSAVVVHRPPDASDGFAPVLGEGCKRNA